MTQIQSATHDTPIEPAQPQAIVPPANDLDAPREATLAEKISAAQARIAERTAPARAKAAEKSKAAATDAKEFVKAHPVIAVSGAVAVGALIALALPGKPGRKVRGSVLSAGGLLAELAATYGSQFLAMAEDAAEASKETLEELGENIAETSGAIAGTIGMKSEGAMLSARHIGEKAALAARQASEDAGFKGRSIITRLKR